MTFSELIAALESANEGSRELDADIAEAIGVPLTPHLHPDNAAWMRRQKAKPYTTSIDAALTLMPAGYAMEVGLDPEDGQARVWKYDPSGGTQRLWEANAPTPALALCIAALKASKAQEDRNG